jgi:hypothetical protein
MVLMAATVTVTPLGVLARVWVVLVTLAVKPSL